MKKYLFIILVLGLIFGVFDFVLAREKTSIEVNFFYSPTCTHCAQEKIFLGDIEKKYSGIEIKRYDAFEKENTLLLKKFYRDYGVPLKLQGWVPIIFIGSEYFLGFNEEIGKEIETCILNLIGEEEPCEPQESDGASASLIIPEKEISLPFIGKVNISSFSSLALAVIMGTLDGFNACAMIALGFLLVVLVGTGIRKRVFLIGGTFIFVSGLVYFLFISAWLNLFLILEQVKIITYFVGAVIIFFAGFLLKDYFVGVVCKLCQINPQKENLFSKLEKKLLEIMQKILVSKGSLPLILLGTAAVAGGINLVELVCSFGFPLAFTKILTARELPAFSYYFYILIYVIFYMIDDFLIFVFAVLTLRITQISQKYLKVIKLISGIVLLVLGLIMIFCPGLLIFG